MQKHYQLLTVDELQKDEAEILEVLSAIRDGRLSNDIKLLNYYRELPVSFEASIDYLERGVVDMRVHDLQAAAMLIEKETFIKSDHLAHDVIAKVIRIRKDRHLAILGFFQYVQITAERRLFVRVRVSERHDATFHYNNQLIHGQIEDISFGGISIAAPKGSVMEENVTGMVSISLPTARLEVSGKLLKVDEDDSSAKHIIELGVDNRSERVISQFIFSQQSRIIRELKDLFGSGPDNLIP